MLHELCYDQVLYLLVVLSPDLVIASILDRFGLLAYFSRDLLGLSRRAPSWGAWSKKCFTFKSLFLAIMGVCRYPKP
jgi:E3 ubiquitin-protein ligase UBR1